FTVYIDSIILYFISTISFTTDFQMSVIFVLFISFGTVIVVSTFIFIGVIIIIIGRPFIIVIVVVSILVFSWCFSVLFVIPIIIPVARIFSFVRDDFKWYIDFFYSFIPVLVKSYKYIDSFQFFQCFAAYAEC